MPRALLLSALIALVAASPLASERAEEHTRSKRFSVDIIPSIPFQQTPPHLGIDRYASGDAGFPFYDFYPKPFFPFWPFISIPQIMPWYTGPNVCSETKYADEPEEFKELLQDLSRDPRSYEQSLHESCRGSNDFYVCRGSKMTNGKMKQYITKYSCCHGFVRNYYAPGCTESGKKVPATKEENSVYMEDSAGHNYFSRGTEN